MRIPYTMICNFEKLLIWCKKRLIVAYKTLLCLSEFRKGENINIFTIAAERWEIHMDYSSQAAFYGYNLYRKLLEIRADKPSVNNIPLQNKLDISCGLLLIKMLV